VTHGPLRVLRSPERGLLGQGFRFALSGVLVALVYLTTTTTLHSVLAVPFQIALAIGFTVAVTVHFTLQRLFVWRHPDRFALPAHHQAARYLLVAGAQYGVTALSTARLPGLLGVPVEVVYVTSAVLVAAINFVVFRDRVFHPRVRHDACAQPNDPPLGSGEECDE
jgi:putative flippase GtrA